MRTLHRVLVLSWIVFGFLPFIFPNLLSAAYTESCLEPVSGNCEFYSECLEARTSCGTQGYAIGYGGKYCRRFTDETRFTAQGETWRTNTRLCLQKSLVSFVDLTRPSSSCEQIMDFAFDSHPYCYTLEGSSICHLPVSDVSLIFNMIEPQDKFSGRGIRQMKAVVQKCIFHLQTQRNALNVNDPSHSRERSSAQPQIQTSKKSDSEKDLDQMKQDLDLKLQYWKSLMDSTDHDTSALTR